MTIPINTLQFNIKVKTSAVWCLLLIQMCVYKRFKRSDIKTSFVMEFSRMEQGQSDFAH